MIQELIDRPALNPTGRLSKKYSQFAALLQELRGRELPGSVVAFINSEIESLNAISSDEKALTRRLDKAQAGIIKLLEKDLKLVTKNHYRTTWLALGMASFGLPLGVVFGSLLDNMAYLGLGLPIGVALGIAVGSRLDQKAEQEGNQLALELKHF